MPPVRRRSSAPPTTAPAASTARGKQSGGTSSASGESPAKTTGPGGRYPPSAQQMLIVVAVLGVLVGLVVSFTATWQPGPLAGWDAAAGGYLIWIWLVITPADGARTRDIASREDPSRAYADVLLALAAVASLVGVGVVIIEAGHSKGAGADVLAGFGVLSVIVSWAVVHTNYTLRYARMYYGDGGGINFNNDEPPCYSDFAYLAFTVGMTFQVSDTDLKTSAFRAAALRQALLSYVFGAVIIAGTINLVAGTLGGN